MNKIIYEVLEKIENCGFQAYIVGGYVRDLLIGNETYDVDICTDALPKDLIQIFDNCDSSEYGSIRFKMGNYDFDITTFRKEIKYENRRPVQLEYIKDLEEDILRRDFTINSLCLTKDGKLKDIMNGKKDLDNKIISLIGDASRLQEDPLRILRAIRFATVLNFTIDEKLKDGIVMYKEYLSTLSTNRIKEEIDKILINKNNQKGLKLLKKFQLLEYLRIDYNEVVQTEDLCGMWAQIEVKDDYPFTKEEKNNISKIKEILETKVLDKNNIFKYGLYISTVTAKILKYNVNEVVDIYNNLKIKSRADLDITFLQLQELLNTDNAEQVKKIEDQIIINIVNDKLDNDYDKIVNFVKQGMII